MGVQEAGGTGTGRKTPGSATALGRRLPGTAAAGQRAPAPKAAGPRPAAAKAPGPLTAGVRAGGPLRGGRGAKYRLRLAKRGAARFLSHLDTMRALLRALRRSGLPVALSQGFNPHLKIAFASALGLGLESEAEFIDVELTEPVQLVVIASRLSEALAPGFELREVRGAPARGRALAAYDAVSRYVASKPATAVSAETRALPAGAARPGQQGPDSEIEALRKRIEDLLGRSETVVERQPGKRVDVRPLIYALRVAESDAAGTEAAGRRIAVELELLSGPSGTARVDEVLRLLGLDPAGWSVLKTDFWPLVGGAKASPWEA